MEPLYRQLEQYAKTDYYPFHMPGHKRNPSCTEGGFPLEKDITEIEGFDNLHHAEGILMAAQERAARLFGAKETFFSVNGSTAALLAAISASVHRGGQLLTARNCHKAVYHGMYLRDLHPVYVFPSKNAKLGINGAISPKDVEKALSENPGVEAVLVTSPTYDGIVSDIGEISKIAHRYDVPLIVDEAHGAHFSFSAYFPASAVELGADLVIQSVHKTLPAMTQTALLHRCSDRVKKETLQQFMGIYQSSSPSYVLMSSIDACADKLERDKGQMFQTYTKRLEAARKRLEALTNIRLLTSKAAKEMGAFAYDCSKLVFFTGDSSLNGHELSEILRREFHLELELEAENYVLALTSVGDREEGFARLVQAVEEIDRREGLKKSSGAFLEKQQEAFAEEWVPEIVLSIADAMEAEQEVLPLWDSEGRISGEFAYLYPPGIPLLVPGEQITGLFLQNVRRYKEQGLSLQGMKEESCGYIYVVKESRNRLSQ